MSITIGIDPGLDGAIVGIKGKPKRVIFAKPMPVIKKGNKRRVDSHKSHNLFIELDILYGQNLYHIFSTIFIEDVHSMPKQGVVSTCTFCFGYGVILTAAEVLQVPIIKVQPGIWKAALGLTADKKESLALATKLMPESEEFWTIPRKKKQNEGVAEAALIAYYGITHNV